MGTGRVTDSVGLSVCWSVGAFQVADRVTQGRFFDGEIEWCNVMYRENVSLATRPLSKLLWDFML